MPLTNAGRDAMTGLTIGVGTLFDNVNAHIGVGDSVTAFSAAQTDLQATTNKDRVGMDSGYPTVSGNVLSFQATFDGTTANYAWNEWGVFNAAAAGAMLNRKVEYNGTKQAGQTWVFEVDLTTQLG